MLSRRNFLLAGGAAAIGATTGLNKAFAQEAVRALPTTTGLVLFPETYIDTMATSSTDPIGITYVFAIDISGSIASNNNEYQSQLDALADTIARDDFRESIFYDGGPGSAAIFVIDYGTNSALSIGGIDLRENDRERFQEVAARIKAIPRRASGGTNHHAGLENAIYCFDNMPWECSRNHVVMMTDGTGNITQNLIYQRYLAQRNQAIVSSLTTEVPNDDIYAWCDANLTTPANKYRRPDRSFLPGGITESVATEIETRGADIGSYKDAVLIALRRLVTIHNASLQPNLLDSPTRFASLDQVNSPNNHI